MANKQLAVICDIDGTIADITHRLHHIQSRYEGDKPRWDEFHEECGEDKPIYPIIRLLAFHYNHGYKIILCTGRNEKYFNKTKAWLEFFGVPYHGMFMRANGDYRSDFIIKEEMLDKIEVDHEVAYVYEDRDRNVKMYRDRGLTCLQVKDGTY